MAKTVGAGELAGKPVVLAIRRSWLLRAKGLLSSWALIWLAIAAYRLTHYYASFLTTDTQKYLFVIAIGYSIWSLIFYSLAPTSKVRHSKPLLAAVACRKIMAGIGSFVSSGPRDYTHPINSVTKEEKNALLFSVIKFFFIPLMVMFMFANYQGLANSWTSLHVPGQAVWSMDGFSNLLYPMLFNAVLVIDVVCFVFGYLLEASFLHSKVRSVEPTVLGWAVALVCYPPFNGMLGNYVPWYANDYASFATSKSTFFLRLAGLIFMGIYASASVALGPKASNLTNRGIVGYGPYRLIRHPAYITKNLAWWVTILPVISLPAIASMSIWSGIYFMRAITEERHLSADPDYLEYCKKVRWRFIPGIL